MSPIDNLDKLSRSFYNCTGAVVTGKDKNTSENISFLSHQDPEYFLDEEKKFRFARDLKRQIEELRRRSIEGSIDAVILGGQSTGKEYVESIKLLGHEISDLLGFEPVVITGPKKRAVAMMSFMITSIGDFMSFDGKSATRQRKVIARAE